LAISPDYKLVAFAGSLISGGAGSPVLQEIKAIPGCIAVSKDGRFLAMGGDKKIIVWQLK
jgi:hypothetical protein